MVSLCIDIGNTLTKLAVFHNNEMTEFRTLNLNDYAIVDSLIKDKRIESAIVSSVSVLNNDLTKILEKSLEKIIYLDHHTPLPIYNGYETKETLGKDRLAAVVGAVTLFQETDLLVIDAGTAITYDIVTKDLQYLGGNISPGLQMRFRALNHFTDRLPLLHYTENFPEFGKETKGAIIAGVQLGIIFEVDGAIDHFRQLYPGIKVLITGGDAKFFDNKLKNAIFVVSNLLMVGLNRILIYNA